MAVWYVRLPASVAKPRTRRPVDLRGERRRQLVGDEHRRLVELAQQIARRGGAVAQVHREAADEVGDVALALAQVRVGDLVEHGAEFLEHLLDGPLGVDALARARSSAARGTSIGSSSISSCASNSEASSGPRRARDARADVDRAAARDRARLCSRRASSCATRAAGTRYRSTCARWMRMTARPDDDAGRHADAGQALHARSSPNPDATRPASASSASRSSAPSALIVNRRPARRRQQQDAHDALAVHLARVARHADVRLEPRRQVHELRRGARVHAELVHDGHRRATSRRRAFSPRSRSDATQIALRPWSRISRATREQVGRAPQARPA